MSAAQPVESKQPDPSASPYEHVGGQAWILLWLAFLLFLVVIIGLPLSVRYYLRHATVPQPVQAEAIRGITLVFESQLGETMPVIESSDLRENDVIRTDENARANVVIYVREGDSNSIATVQLRSSSELVFQSARTPRFDSSPLIDTIQLRLNQGRARVTGSGGERPLQITVETLHGIVRLDGDGDAAITVNNEMTEVISRGGYVEVEAHNRRVLLTSDRRSTIALNEPPSDPLPTAINLIKNGDFMQPLEGSWETASVVSADDLTNVAFGEVTIVGDSERKAAYFLREGDEGIHTETALSQDINVDALDFNSLILRMDVLLLSQSLPGGGQQSSEFPLIARIDFIDVNGNPIFWTHGFYMTDPVQNWPIKDGEKIPSFVWYEYESPDFLNSPTFPRPQKVTGIRIYASGHNYRSQASGIGLIAE